MDGTYAVSVSYDANGRMATQTYPTGFAVKYAYTALGYLTEIRNNATNALYFRADTLDAEGRRVQETYGNSVTTLKSYDPATGRLTQILAGAGNMVQNLAYNYDSLGNLLSRQDGNQNQVEDFLYDGLNRLVDENLQGSGITGILAKSYSYDAIGNIRYKSDVGTYTYGPLNNKPHAVASISGTVNTSFTYDANGNLTSGNGRTEVYTSYNMPQAMGAPGISLAFYYGPEHQRVKQIAPSGTTYYVHPNNAGALLYEKELKASGVTEHRHYIGAVAIYVTRSDSTTQLRYLHQDHLGSVSAITNETGAVIERLAYDPFGKRRFPNGNDDSGNTISGQNTDRGYTLHEHLEELGLIHMNGRIYDPLLGRFMSADPQVQFAADGQSYNRYSYGFNNPLGYTDPSGYGVLSSAWKSVKHGVGKVFRGVGHALQGVLGSTVGRIVVVAVTAYIGVTVFDNVFWGLAETTANSIAVNGALAGAAAGASAGAILGAFNGGWDDAIRGAVYGGISGGIGGAFVDGGALGQMIGGGINGCLQLWSARGCARGFAAGAVPQHLGFKNAYMNDPVANIGIGIVRDGIRGGIVGGRDGILPGIEIGQLNNAVGHLVGWVSSGFESPTFMKGAGAFIYQQKGIFAQGGLTIGNIVGIYDPSDTVLLAHELAHIPQSTLLGAAYLPAHGLALTTSMVLSGDVRGHHSRYNILECSPTFISVPAPGECQ